MEHLVAYEININPVHNKSYYTSRPAENLVHPGTFGIISSKIVDHRFVSAFFNLHNGIFIVENILDRFCSIYKISRNK